MAAPEAKPERPSFVRRAAVSAAGGNIKKHEERFGSLSGYPLCYDYMD